jgi:hypothetical protein
LNRNSIAGPPRQKNTATSGAVRSVVSSGGVLSRASSFAMAEPCHARRPMLPEEDPLEIALASCSGIKSGRDRVRFGVRWIKSVADLQLSGLEACSGEIRLGRGSGSAGFQMQIKSRNPSGTTPLGSVWHHAHSFRANMLSGGLIS